MNQRMLQELIWGNHYVCILHLVPKMTKGYTPYGVPKGIIPEVKMKKKDRQLEDVITQLVHQAREEIKDLNQEYVKTLEKINYFSKEYKKSTGKEYRFPVY